MKNKYFGDINDYRKYGLLRALQSGGAHRLLVAWMLTADDGSTDGDFRLYLQQPKKWQQFDPELFSGLSALLQADVKPKVSLIENSSLLPCSSYYSEPVPDAREDRDRWLQGLLRAASGVDLVFLDPDNGIEVASKPVGRKGSSKYITWEEINAVWDMGCSLLIYQHFRRERRAPFIARMISELQQRTGAAFTEAFRTPHVLFLLVTQARHEARFREAIAGAFVRWKGQVDAQGGVATTVVPRTTLTATKEPTARCPSQPLDLNKGYPAISVESRSGLEPFHMGGQPLTANVLDFWRWSASDLVSNATRGILAEYIVAHALGLATGVRAQWDAYDLVSRSGLKVEVKSSAYLQTWFHRELSTIGFGIGPTLGWNADTKEGGSEGRWKGDVYVFCVLAHKDKKSVDPRDLDQWVFYVLPTAVLDERCPTQKHISLLGLLRLEPIKTDFNGLASAISSFKPSSNTAG